MSLVGFTRLGSLTAPSVTGSASDLPTLVKYEDFTSTMLASLDAGGGDLRFSSDEAGTTQLACEVVTFTKATGDVVWVKVPSVATGALIYVWGDNTGATQPAVGAAFGRNAVWSDYAAVLHLNNTSWTDSTGGGFDGTGIGDVTTTSGNPLGGDWATLDGNGDRITVPTGSTLNNSFLTVQAIVKVSSKTDNSDFGIISNWWSEQNNNFFSITNRIGLNDNLTARLNDGVASNATLTTPIIIGAQDWVVLTTDATSTKVYKAGGLAGEDTTIGGSNQFVTTRDTMIGSYYDRSAQRSLGGQVAEVRIIKTTLTPDQIAIEYDNQSAVGSWWTAADEGGGGPVTQILTPTAIASLETWGSPSVYNVLQILAASGIATGELWGAHTVSTTSGTSILQPSGVASLESWGTPVVTPLIVQLVATAISSLEAWGTPSVLSGVSVLTATGVSSEEAWGTVTLSNLKQYLLASGVISAEAWGNPVLEVLLKVLVAQSIVSGEAWGLPLLAGGDALVVPVAYRQTYNNIAAFLRTQLIKGQDNEVILKWLSNEGYIGNFNEALDDYLRDLGKAGGLQDKFANWRDE